MHSCTARRMDELSCNVPVAVTSCMCLAGMALGMVMQLPEEADEHSVSRRQLLAKLDVCMGGRAAEEMIFGEGEVTTGASSDLQQVSSCAGLQRTRCWQKSWTVMGMCAALCYARLHTLRLPCAQQPRQQYAQP